MNKMRMTWMIIGIFVLGMVGYVLPPSLSAVNVDSTSVAGQAPMADSTSFVLNHTTRSFASTMNGMEKEDVPSFGGMLFRTFGALSLIIILIGVFVYLFRRFVYQQQANGGSPPSVKVLGSTFIAPKKSIMLVRVLDKVLVVGVSDTGMSTLTEFNGQEVEQQLEQRQKDTYNGSFDKVLSSVLGRLKK